MTTKSKPFDALLGYVDALECCTQPVDEHPDPRSIDDCWAGLREEIANERELRRALLDALNDINTKCTNLAHAQQMARVAIARATQPTQP